DLDAMCQLAGRGIEHVDLTVKPAGDPQLFSVSAHVPHVGAAAPFDRPPSNDGPGLRVDHSHAPGTMRWTPEIVGPAVGDIKDLPVAAGINPVRTLAGGNEANPLEGNRIHQVDTVGL